MNVFRIIISVCFLVYSMFVFPIDTQAETQMAMQSGLFQGKPMRMEGTGTSWLPDSSSMHAYHFTSGSWEFMLHWNVFLRYTNQEVK